MQMFDMEYDGLMVKPCEICGVPIVYKYVESDPANYRKKIKKLCWNCEPAKPEEADGNF